MGAELSSKAVFMGNWTGADLMGHLLEGIRASITGIEDQHSDIPPLEGDEDQVVDDFSPMPDMGDQSDQTTLTGTSVHINTSTPSPSLVALPSQATTTTPTLTTSTTPTKQATSRAAPPAPPPTPDHNSPIVSTQFSLTWRPAESGDQYYNIYHQVKSPGCKLQNNISFSTTGSCQTNPE